MTAKWNDEKESIRIDCRINCTDGKVPIEVNPRFLERAICSLLQNAARHTRQRIHMTLVVEENHCTIHVDADGPGIAQADRERIFEPFVQLDDTKERVAQWHGGQIMVEDAPIGGARFTLRWPQIQQTSNTADIRLQAG